MNLICTDHKRLLSISQFALLLLQMRICDTVTGTTMFTELFSDVHKMFCDFHKTIFDVKSAVADEADKPLFLLASAFGILKSLQWNDVMFCL